MPEYTAYQLTYNPADSDWDGIPEPMKGIVGWGGSHKPSLST